MIASSNIEMHYVSTGRGHNDMYWKLLNNGGWEWRVMESNRGVELIKVSIFTARMHWETPVNVDFGIKNER
jgi:hypothetical protein